jgi:hypothetical protein
MRNKGRSIFKDSKLVVKSRNSTSGRKKSSLFEASRLDFGDSQPSLQ